jgi:hypothetical protein
MSSTSTYYAVLDQTLPHWEYQGDLPILPYEGDPAVFSDKEEAEAVRDILRERHDNPNIEVRPIELGEVIDE